MEALQEGGIIFHWGFPSMTHFFYSTIVSFTPSLFLIKPCHLSKQTETGSNMDWGKKSRIASGMPDLFVYR
jgi:hypothetical protein